MRDLMSKGVSIETSWIGRGPDAVARDMRQVERRFTRNTPAWRRIKLLMEADELRHFGEMVGRGYHPPGSQKYVQTGRLMRSLTAPGGPNTIRRIAKAGGGGITFGTTVFYAAFLSKSRKDPQRSGQRRVLGRHTSNKSAVVALLPKQEKAIAKILLDYITEPYG